MLLSESLPDTLPESLPESLTRSILTRSLFVKYFREDPWCSGRTRQVLARSEARRGFKREFYGSLLGRYATAVWRDSHSTRQMGCER